MPAKGSKKCEHCEGTGDCPHCCDGQCPACYGEGWIKNGNSQRKSGRTKAQNGRSRKETKRKVAP